MAEQTGILQKLKDAAALAASLASTGMKKISSSVPAVTGFVAPKSTALIKPLITGQNVSQQSILNAAKGALTTPIEAVKNLTVTPAARLTASLALGATGAKEATTKGLLQKTILGDEAIKPMGQEIQEQTNTVDSLSQSLLKKQGIDPESAQGKLNRLFLAGVGGVLGGGVRALDVEFGGGAGKKVAKELGEKITKELAEAEAKRVGRALLPDELLKIKELAEKEAADRLAVQAGKRGMEEAPVKTVAKTDIAKSNAAIPTSVVDDAAELVSKKSPDVETIKNTDGLLRMPQQESPLLKTVDDVVGPKKRELSFVKTVRESPTTAPEVAAKVKGEYEQITNKETLLEAQRLIDADPIKAEQLVFTTNEPTALTNAVAMDLMRRSQESGNFARAIQIAEDVAVKAKNQGQAIQALAMWARLSPEGALLFAQRQLAKANPNLKLSEKAAEEIYTLAKKMNELVDGRAKNVAAAKLLDKIAEQIPKNFLRKLDTLQTILQLLNPKTTIRNLIGNIGFAGFENVSDLVGAAIDLPLSVITGKRSKAMPSLLKQAKGFSKGFAEGLEDALKGVNTSSIEAGKLDIPVDRTFTGKLTSLPEKALAVLLKAPDRAFYQASYDKTIDELMRATKSSVAEPWMKEIAHTDALYRTFQDSNVLNRALANIKKGLNLGQDFGLGSIVLKYPKTPGSIVMRGLSYSPLGFLDALRVLVAPVTGGPAGLVKQRKFVEATSRALVGTAGLVGTGFALNKLGVITSAPDENYDAADIQRSTGFGEYRINLSALKRYVASGFDAKEAKLKEGDTVMTYDWMQPAAIGMAMGADIAKNDGVNKGLASQLVDFAKTFDWKKVDWKRLGNATVESFISSSETLADQPVLRSLKQMFESGGISPAIVNALKSVPASFMPSLLNQINQLVDNQVRETRSAEPVAEAINRAKSRVPGLAQELPQKYGLLGEAKERYQGGTNTPFNVFLNPAFMSKYQPTKEQKEALDIFAATGEEKSLPDSVDRKIRVYGQNLGMNEKQISEYQKNLGGETRKIMSELLDSKKYNALDESKRSEILTKILTELNARNKVEPYLAVMEVKTPEGMSIEDKQAVMKKVYAEKVFKEMPLEKQKKVLQKLFANKEALSEFLK